MNRASQAAALSLRTRSGSSLLRISSTSSLMLAPFLQAASLTRCQVSGLSHTVRATVLLLSTGAGLLRGARGIRFLGASPGSPS